MGKEIEKKWVMPKSKIDRKVLAQKAHEVIALEQGYLDPKKAELTIGYKSIYCAGQKIQVSDEVIRNVADYIIVDTVIHNFAGYIAADGLNDMEIRYRNYGNEKFVLTIKGKGDLMRFEEEFEISAEQAMAFKKQAVGFVKKERFKINDGTHVLEVDIYDEQMGFDFASVEVEFESIEEANAYQLPEYFGAEAKDVTEIKAFKNKNLAVAGRSANEAFKTLFAVRKIASHKDVQVQNINKNEKGE